MATETEKRLHRKERKEKVAFTFLTKIERLKLL